MSQCSACGGWRYPEVPGVKRTCVCVPAVGPFGHPPTGKLTLGGPPPVAVGETTTSDEALYNAFCDGNMGVRQALAIARAEGVQAGVMKAAEVLEDELSSQRAWERHYAHVEPDAEREQSANICVRYITEMLHEVMLLAVVPGKDKP